MDPGALDYVRAFALTAFAGLSTGIGGLVVFRKKPLNQHIISGSLGLSAGVMIYIAFVSMLRNAFETLGEIYGGRGELYTVSAFFGGILLTMLIDLIVPKEKNPHEMHGIEEVSFDPHTEIQPEAAEVSVIERAEKSKNGSLTRVGMVSAIAIMVHNFPEGLATFVAALADPALGISIALAIAIHNIPEGIAVAVPLYAGTGNKKRSFLVALASGLAEPVGALVGYFIFRPFLSEGLMGIIFAVVAGIMVYISLDELLPSAEKQGEHHIVIGGLILGMAIMAVTLLVL
jgi:ZIP family zinc transporter